MFDQRERVESEVRQVEIENRVIRYSYRNIYSV